MNTWSAIIVCTALAAATAFSARAADLQSATATARADLDKALAGLTALRNDISSERIPLARELRQLESDVVSLRNEANRLQRLSDSYTIDLTSLRNDVAARENEWRYVNDLIHNYLQGFETRVHTVEWDEWRARIQHAESERIASESSNGIAPALLQLLSMATERASGLAGGRRLAGSAVDSDGVVLPGTFLVVGPVAAFSSGNGVTGLVTSSTSIQPHIVSIEGTGDAIAAAVATGTGFVPVDPTQGDALRVAAAYDTVLERVQKGGLWIWPILAFGAAALVVAIVKAIQVLRIKEPTAKAVEEFSAAVDRGDRQTAISLAAGMPAPFDSVFSGLAATIQQPREAQEEIAFERGLEVQMRLERWLPFLSLTAATTPLLGLLGTVTGMIKTFNLIQVFGSGDASRLASGISEALITTEFGLVVAIPALIAHAFLSRRVRGIISSIESICGSILHRESQSPEAE